MSFAMSFGPVFVCDDKAFSPVVGARADRAGPTRVGTLSRMDAQVPVGLTATVFSGLVWQGHG